MSAARAYLDGNAARNKPCCIGNRPPMRSFPALILSGLLIAAPMSLALAQEDSAAGETKTDAVARAERYAACMRLARSEPATGLSRARTWRDTGGAAPARHCEGVALMTLGRYAESGRVLEALAQDLPADAQARLRANALAQAGQAWLLADKAARAEAAYGEALDLRPDDPDLWIDRALARFDMGRYWETIDDLNHAAGLAPERAGVFVYRASAYRHVEAPEMAREDVNRALDLDPDHLEGLLERGILHRLAGREAAAREDWLQILDQAPDSPAAFAARDNLEKMDVEIEDSPS